jgi:hypothetical protein
MDMNKDNVISMDNILNASFGETDNNIVVNFKKTCLVKPYETEVVEADAAVNINGTLTGTERMFLIQLLEAQVEYATYVNLLAKGLILSTEFEMKKKALEESVTLVKQKADALLGVGVIDKYLR